MTVTINGTTGVSLIQDGTATPAKITGSRPLLQMVTYQTGAVATGTTLIPRDNTIPQNTEGDQYLSLAITPSSASSNLEIDVTLSVSNTSPQYQAVALFQDSIANALAVVAPNVIAGGVEIVNFKHIMPSNTVSSTIFKVRSGGNITGTTTINGDSSIQMYGGVSVSRITIKEYAA